MLMNLRAATEEEVLCFSMRSDVSYHVTSVSMNSFDFMRMMITGVVIQAPFHMLTDNFSQKIFTVVDTLTISQGAKHTCLAVHATIKGFRGL